MSDSPVGTASQQSEYLGQDAYGRDMLSLAVGPAASFAATHAMLPMCHICGERVAYGSATHSGQQWNCLRCWGGWLAGAP